MAVILDLFCGEGGATRGYQRAGHRVIGVDNNPKHRAGYKASRSGIWIESDWLHGLQEFGPHVDFIHASPPCQGYTVVQNGTYGFSAQERLIAVVRTALNTLGKPWVMENVGGAKREMLAPTMLTGDMFQLGARLTRHERPWTPRNPGGKGDLVHAKVCRDPAWTFDARIHRVRYFEVGGGFTLDDPPARDPEWMKRTNISITNGSMTDDFHRLGHRDLTIPERQALLGIDWPMTKLGLAEALPPAYTRWIGGQL